MDQNDRRPGDEPAPNLTSDPLETEGGAETPEAEGPARRRRNQEKRARRLARKAARGEAGGGGGRGARGGRRGGQADDPLDDDFDEEYAAAAAAAAPAGAGASAGALTTAADARAARRTARRERRAGASAAASAATESPEPRGASIIVDVQSEEIARRARRRRIWSRIWLWASFIVMVAAPSGLAGWYLNVVAADQYASQVSFAVRSLEGGIPSPLTEIFGGSADSTAGDSEMLFEYLQSQPLVERVQSDVDLVEIYNRPEGDWLFSMGTDRTIEEMVEYWNRAVTVSYDTGAGIIYVEARAFRAQDAQDVAASVLEASYDLINGLSTGARQDAVQYAQADLAEAENRIRRTRVALQEFRSSQGTADISSDISQQMALISQLRSARSEAQAEFDSRKDLLGADSPTLSALSRRIASLDAQIAAEEARIAATPGAAGEVPVPGSRPTLAEAAGEQERLQVELELATHMYTAAQASLEAARAEARRTQRYLATHIHPTLAQEAEYPRRIVWSLAVFVGLLLTWAILLLIVGSIRDRN
ncbi:hypothetical protein [Albimonas pacifica]|uniref:Capsular polysaccharide transport system permease protein n=1 Tax=Albimonas pacifica TaxID=1114924 RepID=A0A1I3C4A9_9RHOB|nr:hypothetical protein [Albimonas pacifica]SFH69233.1 capsular polysaccharide transport system permease protein [Albimonas pacifica]